MLELLDLPLEIGRRAGAGRHVLRADEQQLSNRKAERAFPLPSRLLETTGLRVERRELRLRATQIVFDLLEVIELHQEAHITGSRIEERFGQLAQRPTPLGIRERKCPGCRGRGLVER